MVIANNGFFPLRKQKNNKAGSEPQRKSVFKELVTTNYKAGKEIFYLEFSTLEVKHESKFTDSICRTLDKLETK